MPFLTCEPDGAWEHALLDLSSSRVNLVSIEETLLWADPSHAFQESHLALPAEVATVLNRKEQRRGKKRQTLVQASSRAPMS